MFQVRTFVIMEVVGGPPAGSGGGVGSELVVSIASLFNGWTTLVRRLDSKFCRSANVRFRISDFNSDPKKCSGASTSLQRPRLGAACGFFHLKVSDRHGLFVRTWPERGESQKEEHENHPS